MLRLRLTSQRGLEDKGWMKSYYSFSFENYYDPDSLCFRHLCVLNEIEIKGRKGLGEQVHKDMEVLSYVISGVLEYKDSLGNTSVIKEGEMFLLSSGTGLTHSEYNLSHHVPVRFLQMWFTPNQEGLSSSISQKMVLPQTKWDNFCLLVSPNGREGSLKIHQDVHIYSTMLREGAELTFSAQANKYYWIQVISGKFFVQKEILHAGDGLALSEETNISFSCTEEGEFLLIEQG